MCRNKAKMYDIKSIEFGQQTTQEQIQNKIFSKTNSTTTNNSETRNPGFGVAGTTTTTAVNSRLGTAPTATATISPYTSNAYSTCSVISASATNYTSPAATTTKLNASESKTPEYCNPSVVNADSTATHMTLLSLRRRRLFQRQACLLSILAAFVFGLVLGVFMPMFGLANVFATLSSSSSSSSSAAYVASSATATGDIVSLQMLPIADNAETRPLSSLPHHANRTHHTALHHRPPSDFPTIYELSAEAAALDEAAVAAGTSTSTSSITGAGGGDNPFSVAFIKERDVELSAEEVFRNVFHLEQDRHVANAMIVKQLDTSDGSIREFRVQRTPDGRFIKRNVRKLSKTNSFAGEKMLQDAAADSSDSISFVPLAQRIVENARNQRNHGIIKSDIYWGDLVERALPQGFTAHDAKQWNSYVASRGVAVRLEPGCGRMQNRLIIFADGTRACARYRQNTDQIQGELFSFYLGQLLNMSNLAPSAAAVIDTESRTWSSVLTDITQAQWKQQRPVVLTRWLPELEPAGIPQPFQPLERHLNKYDVWNITLGAAAAAAEADSEDGTNGRPLPSQMTNENQKGLLKRLEAASNAVQHHQSATLELSSSSLTAATTNALNATKAAAAASTSFLASSASSSSPLSSSSSSASSSVVLQRLIELAQWSDLIVFDYLIANLDRVVNNLYNFQWNADIMAAPAHNLARQTNSQLLVFLDNESGLLHGYRLLKKYEAYHGLLLDNLCVFRQPTIEALRQLRSAGAGRQLRELFEQTTSAEVRDVLPTLPDKSIKILVDRIDRVLGQVQKCKDLLAER